MRDARNLAKPRSICRLHLFSGALARSCVSAICASLMVFDRWISSYEPVDTDGKCTDPGIAPAIPATMIRMAFQAPWTISCNHVRIIRPSAPAKRCAKGMRVLRGALMLWAQGKCNNHACSSFRNVPPAKCLAICPPFGASARMAASKRWNADS